MKPYFGRCAVLGYGKTGKSLEKLLKIYGNRVNVYDEAYGNFNLNDIQMNDVILPSPGIPFWKIERLMGKNWIISDIDLGYMCNEGKFVGITGTNGKTTVAMMLEKALENSIACGNVGLPLVDAPRRDYYIVELSSFQLFYTKFAKFDMGIILNISPDHLDWHRTYEHYLKSKLKLSHLLKNDALLILNMDDENLRELKTYNEIWYFSMENEKAHAYFKDGRLYIFGDELGRFEYMSFQMKYNLMAVSLALYGIKGSLDEVKYRLRKLLNISLPYRMNYLGKLNGIDIYNDSKSTNPHSLSSALMNFEKVVLIMGGYCKGLSFKDISKIIRERTTHVILFGRDVYKILEDLNDLKNVHIAGSLEEAFERAMSLTQGEPILFSPGCASFDMFKNYEERGRYFENIVYNFKPMVINDERKLLEYLKNAKTIAVIGIKDGTDTPAGRIPRYLKAQGYKVIPVNPKLQRWLGEKVYKSIDEVEEEVDIVDIFRRSEAVIQHAHEILKMKHKPKLVWLQEGIVNEEAAKLLSENGIDVVMDKCIYKVHSKFKEEGLL